MPALPRLLRISSLLVAGALLYVGWQRLVDAAFAPVTELDELYPYRDEYLDQILTWTPGQPARAAIIPPDAMAEVMERYT